MADNQTATAVAEAPYTIRVEDAGPATKKVHVEIPADAVKSKIQEQFKELREGAVIPGFRKGRAPQKLLEKKFSGDIKEQVRRALISESYKQAIDDNSLAVLGEPEFDNPEAIQLADGAPLNYSFTVEVQPQFELPELKGMPVKRPKIVVTDEHINQAMTNLREQQGSLVPVTDRGVEEKDYVIGDVQVKVEGNVVSSQPDAQLVARPGRIVGLQIDDLATQLAGAKPGDTRNIKTIVPDTYPNESLRGKAVEIDVTVKDLKRLQAAEINQEFLDSLGFKDEAELREALKEQMDERIAFDIQNAMRRQVTDQLLEKVTIELPAKLAARQSERVVQRRAMELMMRGMSLEQVQGVVGQLSQGAVESGVVELKTFFILGKVAEQNGIDVSEGELNGRIAMLAMQQGKRPEKLKQELAKDGSTLSNLYVQMREEKAIDKILETAQIEDVDPKTLTESKSENPAT